MSSFVLNLLLLAMQCLLLNGSQRVMKKIYKPYGPKMCTQLCEGAANSFIFNKGELSCQRLFANDSRIAEIHPTGDSFTCRNKDTVMSERTALTVPPKHDNCVTDLKGQGPDDPLQQDNDGNTTSEYLEFVCTALHRACKKGMVCRVQYILSKKLVDINCRGKWGRTPVMVAAGNKQVAVFDFLVSEGCDLEAVDDHNDTVLHVACMDGDTDIIRKLIAVEKWDIDVRGDYRRTPVMVAAVFGHGEAFDLLVTKGSNMKLFDMSQLNTLHIACQHGNVDVVRYILSHKIININSRGYFRMTPVMFAAERGHVNAYVVLENKACDLKAVDKLNRNVLHVACSGGHVDMVKYIISQKRHDTESREHKQRTPVMIAAIQGHVGVLDILVRKGCNLTKVDVYKNNILHMACRNGHADMVEHILSQGKPDIESKGSVGRTPVMIAVLCCHQRVVDILINKGCNLKSFDAQGNNILHLACLGGHSNIIPYILSNKLAHIDSTEFSGMTPVMVAALNGHKKVVKLLVRNECNLRTFDKRMNNILHIACAGGHVHMVKYFLSKATVNIDSKGFAGRTPVMLAAERGNKEVFELLVRKGCNIRALDVQTNSVLHVACLGGHVDMVQYILSKNILHKESTGFEGRTPVMVAASMGHMEVVELLVKQGCNLRVIDEQKNNILHVACLDGHVDMVRYILSQAVSDIDSKGIGGRTPVLLAAGNGHMEVVKLLWSNGCDPWVLDSQKSNILHVACIGGHVQMVRYVLNLRVVDKRVKNIFGMTPLQIAESKGYKDVVALLKMM